MTLHTRPTRRGVALLIVLAALVLVTSTAVIAANVAMTARLRGHVDAWSRQADDLLWAAEAPILDWLAARSTSVVLPPDATAPEVTVLDDAWEVAGVEQRLTITAWDQCAMVPLQLAWSGSVLRLALPPEIAARVDRVDPHGGRSPLGLDVLVGKPTEGDSTSPFPVASSAEPVRYGSTMIDATVVTHLRSLLDEEQSLHPRPGALVATHNNHPPAININTAPRPLLEQALRIAGRGGLESILEARASGRQASTTALMAITGEQDRNLQIVPSSHCWSFRVDAAVGAVHRSWWLIYRFSTGQWHLEQRLVIPD